MPSSRRQTPTSSPSRPHARGLRPRRAWALLASTLLGTGCTYARGDANVLVTSTPAGAEILVDGSECGKTTPSMLDLGGIAGSDHTITVRKRGFADETRQVFHYTTAYTSNWNQGVMDPGLLALPLWWPLGDWLLPVGVRWRYVPHELHVKLYKEGEGPVAKTGSVER